MNKIDIILSLVVGTVLGFCSMSGLELFIKDIRLVTTLGIFIASASSIYYMIDCINGDSKK